MFVFLTKVDENGTTVTYKLETETVGKPFRNDKGHTIGQTKTVSGSGHFNKQTNKFHVLPESDPYFLAFNQEVIEVEKALQKIHQEQKPFPPTLEVRN